MKRAILGSPHSLAHHTIAAASLSSSRVQELLKHITCKRRDVCIYMPPLIQDLMSRLHLAVTVPGHLLSSFDQAGTTSKLLSYQLGSHHFHSSYKFLPRDFKDHNIKSGICVLFLDSQLAKKTQNIVICILRIHVSIIQSSRNANTAQSEISRSLCFKQSNWAAQADSDIFRVKLSPVLR